MTQAAESSATPLQVVPMPFPSKGVHQSSAISQQPEGTSPLAQNVRSYDLVARRDRGCQRSGLSRLPNAVNAGSPIDLIRVAMMGQTIASFGGLAYTYSAGTMDGAGNGDHTVGTPVFSNNYYSSAYQVFKVSSNKTAMPSSGAYATFTPGFAGMAAGTITYQASINYQGGTCVLIATFSPGNGNYYVSVALYNNQVVLSILSPRGSVTDFYPIAAISTGTFSAHIEIGLTGIVCKNGATTLLNHSYTTAELALIGDIFNTSISAVVYGTAIVQVAASVPTPGSDLYGAISISASAGGNFDPLSEQICYLQQDGAGKGVVTVGTVIGGFTEITSSATDGWYAITSQLDMTAGYSAFWLVDGVHALRKVDPIAAGVTFPAATAGSLPALARIITLYRGRLFHGGILTDPYNWFASRSGDPLDYNYGALDSAGAVAGNNGSAQILGDYLTAMIPYGNVSMVMGMGSSIAVMRGDPKAGGDIAILSREVGIAALGAWCRSPDGTIYFMARDGLYRIGDAGNRLDLYGSIASATPRPISRGRLDATLGRIDWTQFTVIMCWDPLELGVKIVIRPFDTTRDTTVVFWEERKDAFWVDVIPAAIAPRAIAGLRGSGGPGGITLYGGFDGWIRFMNPNVYTDDGLAISSLVRYPPLTPYGQNVKAKLVGMRQLYGSEAGVPVNAQYAMYVGDDPVSASVAAVDQRGTITTGGYQSLAKQRSRGNTIILELSNTVLNKTWQIEETSMMVKPSGRVRA